MVLIQELTGYLLLFNIFIYNTKPVLCNPVVWNYNCTMMTQTTCVQPQYMNMTYSEAQSFCNFNLSQGNVRADILHISPSTQDSIVKQGTDMKRVWTGASVIDHQWRWILNSKTIPTQLQGCFTSKLNLSDLIAIGDITTSSPSMTATKCMKYCQDKRGFEYSTVSLESQGGNTQTITCRCSRQFWPQIFNNTVSEVAAVSCHTTCPSDTTQFCGGHNNTYLVYNINGKVYTNFVPNTTTDNTHCTVLSTGETAWLKRSCKESKTTGYICDLPDKSTRNCEQSHPNNMLVKGKKCITFRTSNLNWFQASQECAMMNGHLLLLDRTDIESDILSRMGSHYPNKDTEWWIGLTSGALVWSDGSPVTNYLPSMWGKGEPNMNAYNNCAVMDTVLNYTWYLTDCNELNQFYCNIKQDGCSGKTCKHGGTCTGVYNRHTCVCTPRWTGTNCEVSINQALTAPSTAPTAAPINTSDSMTPIVVGIALAVLAVITVIILILLLLYRQKSKKISRELSAIKKNKRGHSMLHRIASIFTIYEKIEEDRNSSFRRLNENGEVRFETIQEPPELPFRESTVEQVPETSNTHNQETGENCIVETERTATTDCEGYQSLHNTEISVPVSYQSLEGVGYETLQTELKSTPTDVYTKLNSTAPKNVKQENTDDKSTEQSQGEHSRPTEEMSVDKCDSLAESVGEEQEQSSCDGRLKAQDSKTACSHEESISTQTHFPEVGKKEENTGNNNTDLAESHYLTVLDSSQDNPET